jgi:hypothetical protein
MVMAILIQTWVSDIYGDVTMPDTRISYTINEITEVFNALGQEGLFAWAQAHMLDFVFPLTYTFALSFGINLENRRAFPGNESARKLVIIPLMAGLLDYLENILILTQIASYPSLSEIVILIASIVTSMKWAILMLGFAVVFSLIPVVLYRRFSRSDRSE